MGEWRTIAAALLLLSACSESNDAPADQADTDAGETSSGGLEASTGASEAGSTGETPEEPTLIPSDVAQTEVDGWCASLGADRVVGVGSNAEVWIASPSELGTSLRALSGGVEIQAFEVEGDLVAVSALDGGRATVVTTSGVFTVDGPRVDTLAWPSDPAEIVDVCGDLSVDGDGRVLAEDVFTRDLGQWWRWNAPDASVGPDVARAFGACSDRDDTTFVLNGTEAWRVRPDFIETLPEYADARVLAADEAFGLAAIRDGDVWIGPAVRPTSWLRFDVGEAEAMQAGEGLLVVSAGDHLYAVTGDDATELVDADGALSDVTLVGVAAEQVVFERAGEVCAFGAQPTLRVTGVRPLQRVRMPSLDIVVDTDASVSLDGSPVTLDVGDESASAQLELSDEGWHELEVAKDGRARVLAFEVERLVPATFTQDIAPLFDAHCSGEACHGPNPSVGEQPDLSNYDRWVEKADAIRERVAVTADMPPPGSSDEPWGVEQTLLLLGWLDAGLPEGE